MELISADWEEPKKNPARLLLSYMGERLPVQLYLPLSLFIAFTSLFGGTWPWSDIPTALFWRTIIAFSLLGQFRLRDDICFRFVDSIYEPKRALSSSASTIPFSFLFLSFLGLNIWLLQSYLSLQSVFWFLGITLTFELFYAINKPQPTEMFVNVEKQIKPSSQHHSEPKSHCAYKISPFYVFLSTLRYPIFVLLLMGVSPRAMKANGWYGLILSLLAFSIFEVLYDKKLRGQTWALHWTMAGLASVLSLFMGILWFRDVLSKIQPTAFFLAISFWLLFASFSLRSIQHNRYATRIAPGAFVITGIFGLFILFLR